MRPLARKAVTMRAAILVGCLLVAVSDSASAAIVETSVVTATNTTSVAVVLVNAPVGSTLVAMVAGAGPQGSSTQTSTVSGCVSWVLIKRANTRPGVADVWKSATNVTLASCPVTVRLSAGSYFVRLVVTVMTGAGTVGTSASASSNKGPAQVMLAGLTAGSLIYGAGTDLSIAQARTVLPGQRKLADSTSGTGTFWAQALSSPTTTASVLMGTSAPATKTWNFAAVEITPATTVCTVTASPTLISANTGAGSAPVTISANVSTCNWLTTTGAAWLSVTPTSGTGNGTVTVSYTTNTGATRSGTVTVAGSTVTVTQAGATIPTLTTTCPANLTTASLTGAPVAVSYPLAATSGGLAPVNVIGSPSSGSLFPVGTTMVTQTATSADGQSTSCTFGVTVTAPTMLINPSTIDITPSADYTALNPDGSPMTTGIRVQYFAQGATSPVMVNDLCKPPLVAGHVVVTASACSGGLLFGTPLALNTTYVVTATQYGPGGESPRSQVSNLFELR